MGMGSWGGDMGSRGVTQSPGGDTGGCGDTSGVLGGGPMPSWGVTWGPGGHGGLGRVTNSPWLDTTHSATQRHPEWGGGGHELGGSDTPLTPPTPRPLFPVSPGNWEQLAVVRRPLGSVVQLQRQQQQHHRRRLARRRDQCPLHRRPPPLHRPVHHHGAGTAVTATGDTHTHTHPPLVVHNPSGWCCTGERGDGEQAAGDADAAASAPIRQRREGGGRRGAGERGRPGSGGEGEGRPPR